MYQHLDRSVGPTGTSEADLFTGAGQRRVLADGESIEPLMVEACRRALNAAGLAPEEVDRLYGYASVPEYFTPNPLYRIHQRLGLRPDTLVVPINSDFSNFVQGVLHADESITAGKSANALVVTGSSWTRHLDYTRGHAQAASDGAGAALVGRGGRLTVVDHASYTDGSAYESMTMGVRQRQAQGWAGIPVDAAGTPIPTYLMDPDLGMHVYATIMWDGLPTLVNELLARHGLTGADTALITHQGSRALLDHWSQQIRPAQHLETLSTLGNLTNATYPVNLAVHDGQIVAPYLVIAAVGTGFHLAALLLQNHRE
ncbi:hypothetical protein ACIOWF_20475 [Cellulosimicrobium cellulans]|uniref:hypothetical protein n=1 Tax=Cellulosimicrobium cellulans TaxID=1710 RepID=UPI003802F620